MTDTAITKAVIATDRRIIHTAKLFGIHFPLHLEPFIFSVADNIAKNYNGAYWEFFELSNGAFYMAPDGDTLFEICCDNGFDGTMSGDALGITACLYAYSNLSFGKPSEFTETCARQYHVLREYMFEHPEAGSILGAID